MSKSASASFLAACIAMPCGAQFVESRDTDYPLTGVTLGTGWSSLSVAKTAGACVEFTEAIDLSEDRTLELRRVFDKEQLNRTLDISAEFQAKSMGGIGGSAKATYSKSVELKNEALNIVVVARVRQGAKFVTAKAGTGGIKLTQAALDLLNVGVAEFVAVCGDTYVGAIRSGGELNALLTFSIASSDEREVVSASVQAGGLSYSGSVSVNQTLKKYRESSQLTILMHSAGGTGIPLPVNEQEMMERVKSLPLDAKTAPQPYTITLSRYDRLANWPLGTMTTPKFAEMRVLVSQLLRYNSLYLNMFDMVQAPGNFVWLGTVSPASVSTVQDDLRNRRLPALKIRLDECLAGGSCSLPAEGIELDYEIRWMLPILSNSFAGYAQLQQLQANVVTAVAARAAIPATLDPFKGNPFAEGKIFIPHPAIPKADADVLTHRSLLANGLAIYPVQVADAMFKQWIELPAYSRCVQDSTWNYCLSQAALNTYRDRIASNVRP